MRAARCGRRPAARPAPARASRRSARYKAHFWPRDLQAFSARPLLAQPTHYAGDAAWLSDTETSSLWDDDSGRLTRWSGSRKALRGPRLGLAGGRGHSPRPRPRPRDEL